MKSLKPLLLVGMLAASAGASAQQYYPTQQQYYPSTTNTGEAVLQVILDQVIGSRYTSNNNYRSPEQQELFRRADVNRDGYLTQNEVDNYRARMGYNGYDRNGNNGNAYGRSRGIPVSYIDTNRDGYVSREEANQFIRMMQHNGSESYYNRNDYRR